MNFSLEWKESAGNELAELWLRSDSAARRRITAAVGKVDHLLTTDPFGSSESREAGRRILFVAPLAVTFRVDPAANRVDVLRVRQFGRHG